MVKLVLVDNKPDFETRSCFDCGWRRIGLIGDWCKSPKSTLSNKLIRNEIIKCPYWEPCKTKSELSIFEKLFKPNLIYCKGKTP